MVSIKWDEVGSRTYESGIDRGVIYLWDGKVVPWNGLRSINEKSSKSLSPVYFDGIKIHDVVEIGNFEATLEAITYPFEIMQLEGLGKMINGVYLGDQKPGLFNLSYRTRVGNDTQGPEADYQIHVIYNVSAVPSDKSYESFSDSFQPISFEWDLTATPQEIKGFRPTAHFILDSRYVDPVLLSEIEFMLYGGETANPKLPTFDELASRILTFVNVEIIDNFDGTWTAFSNDPTQIVMINATEYTVNANVVYDVGGTFYEISSE